MPSLRVLWLSRNNLQGMLPLDLARSRSLISIDTRYNPRLCGSLPPGLRVQAIPGDWKGFCDKAHTEDSECALLTSPDTGLGSGCASSG